MIGVLLALVCMAVPATADSTPFIVNGYISDFCGNPCNEPWVRITNTSESWDAVNHSAWSYYRLIISSNDVSAGNVLRFDASGCDLSKTVNRTVTSGDAIGFTLNITLGSEDPDLTLTSIEPTTFYAGQANLIRATIGNIGRAASAFDVAMKQKTIWAQCLHDTSL